MDLAQQALLRTVDRILVERGEDPSVIAPQDKINLATQFVQLCVLHEHVMRKTAQELAEGLGASPNLPLIELAADARIRIENQRSSAA